MTTPEESYRALVQRYMRAGQLSADAQETLEIDRAHLGLLPATARSIEQAVAELAVASVVGTASPLTNPPPVLIPVIPVVEPPEPNLAVTLRLDNNSATVQPQRSADYQAHRQQYKQELMQALQKDGPLLSDEAFAHLKKLEEQFGLSFDDVAQIYEEVMQEITTGKPLPASVEQLAASLEAPPEAAVEAVESEVAAGEVVEAKGDPVAPETKELAEPKLVYASQLAEPFEQLEKNLAGGNLRAADQITRDILFELIKPKRGWIDSEALQAFNLSPLDKVAIKTLDHLWLTHTPTGGFGRQLQVFGEVPQERLDSRQNDNRLQVLEFSREVGWWAEGLEFFKLYDQLDFTVQAPQGHLPALWYWKKIPRLEAFKCGNFGLFEERGGCRIEGYILPAFMRLLNRCGLESD